MSDSLMRASDNKHGSMQAAAERVAKATGGALDVLINNGAYISPLSAWIQIDE